MLLTLAAFAVYGPPPGPIALAVDRPITSRRTVLNTGGGSRAVVFDLAQGLLAYAGDVSLIDPRTGKVRWHTPWPEKGSFALVPKQVAIRGNWVALLGASDDPQRYWDIVLILDLATGRPVGRVEASEEHHATSIRWVGDRVALNRPRGETIYAVTGEKIAEGLPFPELQDAFRWGYGRIEWLAFEDYPMDIDPRFNGLRGVAYSVPTGNGGRKDAWSKRFLRRVYSGYAGRGTHLETTGAPATDYYVRAICADDAGAWLLRVRGTGTQIVGVGRAGGLVWTRPRPLCDVSENLPAWTTKGIVFVQGSEVLRFDGSAARLIGTLTDYWGGALGIGSPQLTRWGIVRTVSRSRNDSRWSVVYLDPVRD